MGISTIKEGSVNREGGVEIGETLLFFFFLTCPHISPGAMWGTPTLVKMPENRPVELGTDIPARLAGIRSRTLISTARRASPNPSSPYFSIPNMRL